MKHLALFSLFSLALLSMNIPNLTKNEESPGRFYYDYNRCGPNQVQCCCSDGNGMVCDVMGIQMTCLAGGVWECDVSAGCLDNYGDCERCCNPCVA